MTKQKDKKIEDIEETKEPKETAASAESSGEPKEENSELEQLKTKIEESDNNYKRALADYQNLQKRVTDERRDFILAANKDLLLRILTVLDTLILANNHDGSEGLKVAISQFLDVLKSEGVTKIETEGIEFDPHLMEAVAIEKGDEGKVLEETRTGYLLNDKVLRVAQVKVGSAKQNGEE